MREKDALTKWCPMTRGTPGDLAGSKRGYLDDTAPPSTCIASKCMMWRWLSGYTADHGYCGLAGFTTPRPKE